MTEQKPSVGRIVHYVSYGTPVRADGSQTFTSKCRAAIVTEICGDADPEDDNCVSLAVLNPTGMFFDQHVAYHDGGETPGKPDCPNDHAAMPFRYCPEPGCGWIEASHQGGTWHWPERV